MYNTHVPKRNREQTTMNHTLRLIAIVAAAIVMAVIALKILAVVTFLLWKLVTLVFFLGLLYVLFLVARSAVRKRTTAH